MPLQRLVVGEGHSQSVGLEVELCPSGGHGVGGCTSEGFEPVGCLVAHEVLRVEIESEDDLVGVLTLG